MQNAASGVQQYQKAWDIQNVQSTISLEKFM